MIQVGIVGSLAVIKRHTDALGKIQDIRITGCWIPNDEGVLATCAETGEPCISAGQITSCSDALIIATGDEFSRELATHALREARHIFVYPGIARSVNEATQLVKLAREAGVILRAGKTGNYNVKGMMGALHGRADINMIELQHDYRIPDHSRISMPDAVLADLEVINSLVGARTISIKAKGHCMLSSEPDIINARLEFDNGCAVNYNCSLVAAQNEFLCTLVLKDRVLKYNFITGELTSSLVLQSGDPVNEPIHIEHIWVGNPDTLTLELTDFFSHILSGPVFQSMNENGFEPFMLADRILERVMKTLVRCS